MTFPDAADAVKESLDVVDIVSRQVVLKKSGRNYTGLCPFHKDTKPSFSVSAEKGIYKCFSCGEGGDALAFLMKTQAKTYAEVITELAEEMGITIQRDRQSAEAAKQQQSDRQRIESLNQLAQQYFQAQLQAPVGQSVQEYLANRQLPQGIIQQFGLGYAPQGWENLLQVIYQHHPEYKENPKQIEFLETAGLAMRRGEGNGAYDRFRNRLMIPIFDEADRLVAFGGRALSSEDNPKYLNSPETPIYHKSKILYGLNIAKNAIRETKTAMVMEGYFDVMAAHEAGCTYAVGSCGTALTEQHVKQLLRFGAETIILAFDSDEAGQKAAESSIQLIQPLAAIKNLRLRVLNFPGDKDPDDYLRHHGAEGFQSLVAHGTTDALTFQLNRAIGGLDVNLMEEKIAAVQRVLPILARITQPVKLRDVIEQLASRLKARPEDLFAERQLYRERHYPEEVRATQNASKRPYSQPYKKNKKSGETKYYNSVSKVHQKAIHPIQGALQENRQQQSALTSQSVAGFQSNRLQSSVQDNSGLSRVLQRQQRLEKALMTLFFVSPQHTVELFPLVLSRTYADDAFMQFAQVIQSMEGSPLQAVSDALRNMAQEKAEVYPALQGSLTDILFDADVYDQRFQASGSTAHQISRALQQDAKRFLDQLRQCDRLKQLAPVTEQLREMEKNKNNSTLLMSQEPDGQVSLPSSSPSESSLLGLQYEFRDKLSQHRLPPDPSTIVQDDALQGEHSTGNQFEQTLPDDGFGSMPSDLNC